MKRNINLAVMSVAILTLNSISSNVANAADVSLNITLEPVASPCVKPRAPTTITELRKYAKCLADYYESEKGGLWSDVRVKRDVVML